MMLKQEIYDRIIKKSTKGFWDHLQCIWYYNESHLDLMQMMLGWSDIALGHKLVWSRLWRPKGAERLVCSKMG